MGIRVDLVDPETPELALGAEPVVRLWVPIIVGVQAIMLLLSMVVRVPAACISILALDGHPQALAEIRVIPVIQGTPERQAPRLDIIQLEEVPETETLEWGEMGGTRVMAQTTVYLIVAAVALMATVVLLVAPAEAMAAQLNVHRP